MTTIDGQIGNLRASTANLGALAIDTVGDGCDDASVLAGSHGVATGSNAEVGRAYDTAVGGDGYAAGPATGGNAWVGADGSTAVGANSMIAVIATNAVAVGESASVTAASGTYSVGTRQLGHGRWCSGPRARFGGRLCRYGFGG